ncbi:MAG: 16S rRNA (uracil(1498)-N(3))-methyltransferase [Firmicutes bacterium]|nr:16S rRNA (uracil(1498)-N(3))-methyltransferase [Bacillota bacterium]
MRRVFVNSALGNSFELDSTEHNHLANVTRAKIGEEVICINGDAFDYHYKITNISKSKTALQFIKKQQNTSNPTAKVTIFLAAIKSDNLHLVITKLNEIGASNLVLFNADRSNTSLKQINLIKCNAIAQQSCKQCGRSIPLMVSITNQEPQEALKGYSQIIFADECEKTNSMNKIKFINNCAIIIGAEGGFTPNERTKILAVKNVTPVTLGRRILRAETACITTATLAISQLEI